MEPLRAGQPVTYVDSNGAAHTATVVEPYAQAALVNVPDLSANLIAGWLRFEDTQAPPYLTDANGSQVTETTFEARIAEE